MFRSRIKEIRKARGLTLQEVADRIKPNATTPQTIGRLENGKRTLSIDWIERIAVVLECDPSELLALPQGGDLAISGMVQNDGSVASGEFGTLRLRLVTEDAIAFLINETIGQYCSGDIVVCKKISAPDFAEAAGSDCLIETREGKTYFTKIAQGSEKKFFTLLPVNATGVASNNQLLTMVAPVSFLYRRLS